MKEFWISMAILAVAFGLAYGFILPGAPGNPY